MHFLTAGTCYLALTLLQRMKSRDSFLRRHLKSGQYYFLISNGKIALDIKDLVLSSDTENKRLHNLFQEEKLKEKKT